MIAWANVVALAAFTVLAVGLYVRSVRPAALERGIGPSAWRRCGRLRTVAGVCMMLCMACCVLYVFYPLPLGLPARLPWPRRFSTITAAMLAVPATYLVGRGMCDAGREALTPQREGAMYGGIYRRIRHPQAWEVLYWFVLALLLHSPFVFLYALVWLPLEYWMVMAEERDLVLRFGQAYEDYRRRTGAFWPRSS